MDIERLTAENKVVDYMAARRDMTLPEIFYSILRPRGSSNDKISDSLGYSNSDIITRVETAQKEEENE